MVLPGLSLTEWAVLALLAEAPVHPFAISRHLGPGGDVGRILTVRRPLVYRALERLVASGLAVPDRVEPGQAGPRRTVHRVTPAGAEAVQRWLLTPVEHVRDVRLELLLKVDLLRRSGRSAAPLVAAQREALSPALAGLITGADQPDVVSVWRRHTALATAAFLDELAAASESA